MRFKFGINSVIFLVFILLTAFAWIGFEAFHQNAEKDLDPVIINQANSPIQDSFDIESLRKIYQSNSKYYEVTIEPTPITQQ